MSEQQFTQEEANQFIIDCHGDLDTVKEKVASTPGLVNAYNPETIESALGATAHMGQREIAEFLLENGAEPELGALAMLGRRDEVQAWLQKDPAAAQAGGAHRIPVAFHAAISGDTGIMQLLWEAGEQEQVKNALLGAVAFNKLEMARWLLGRGARTDVKSFDGKTALEIAQDRGFAEIADLLESAAG